MEFHLDQPEQESSLQWFHRLVPCASNGMTWLLYHSRFHKESRRLLVGNLLLNRGAIPSPQDLLSPKTNARIRVDIASS
jgi:hypothetical protein